MQLLVTANPRKLFSFVFAGLVVLISAFALTGCKCNSQTDDQCNDLTVTMAGTGSGKVTSVPDGIDCEPACSQGYVTGSPIALTASPYSGSEFTDWSGGCSGTGPCTVTMNQDTTITAEFNLVATEVSDLVTPYVNETDMAAIHNGFSTFATNGFWNFIHDGMDIYPNDDLKPFQAVCDGRVRWMYTGDEQVLVMLACNSTYTAEYNFESQAPNTGQTQLANILVTEGQVVAQGDLIGRLFVGGPDAHVHFSLHRNWVPTCPEPYFSPAANASLLNLLHEKFPQDAVLCYGDNVTPPPMVTPYVDETEMTEISAGFSTEFASSPWGFVHEGLDIFPQGDRKAFHAACAGTVDGVELVRTRPGANWQVKVLIQCEDYVPNDGGYFIPFSVEYIFEPMTKAPPKAQQQLADITVVEGEKVLPGDIIGYLHAARKGAHVQFGLVQFGSSEFSALGVPRLPICPEPHFSTAARDSVLNLLHVAWPSANMCYQN